MRHFVHLLDADDYLPGLWDFASEHDARLTWAARLRTHLADTLRHARAGESPETADHLERVAPRWEAVIDRLADLDREPPGRTVLELVAVRDALFRGEPAPGSDPDRDAPRGPIDPFARVKAASNVWALERYGETIAVNGPPPGDRLDAERLARGLAGLLVGNVLDVASAEVAEAARAGESAVERIAARVRERPPSVDGRAALSPLLTRLRAEHSAPSVLLFADNAGMDFILGVLPFSRELLGAGFRVALAANERPALNDVTADEAERLVATVASEDPVLARFVESGALCVLSTGNATPGIDLRNVTEAVNRAACDLAVFVGQGRAVETTWNAVLACPAVRVATLKSSLVASRLGLRTFDTIADVREAGAVAPACNPDGRDS